MATLQALKHRARLVAIINETMDGLTCYELYKVLRFVAGTKLNPKRKAL
jgi:hypothetical protein